MSPSVSKLDAALAAAAAAAAAAGSGAVLNHMRLSVAPDNHNYGARKPRVQGQNNNAQMKKNPKRNVSLTQDF